MALNAGGNANERAQFFALSMPVANPPVANPHISVNKIAKSPNMLPHCELTLGPPTIVTAGRANVVPEPDIDALAMVNQVLINTNEHPLRGRESCTAMHFQAMLQAVLVEANRTQWPVNFRVVHGFNVQVVDAGIVIGGQCEFVITRNGAPFCVVELKQFQWADRLFNRGRKQAITYAAAIGHAENAPTMRAIVADLRRWEFIRVSRRGYRQSRRTHIAYLNRGTPRCRHAPHAGPNAHILGQLAVAKSAISIHRRAPPSARPNILSEYSDATSPTVAKAILSLTKAMLTETEAWTLLQRHCGPLTDTSTTNWVGFDHHLAWTDVAREQLDLLLLPMDSSYGKNSHTVGAQLRLALGVAHAPSPQTFNHVAIEWARFSRKDEPFWIGFLHGTPECDAKLAAVHETLTPHFITGSPPPPLRVALSRCTSNKTRYVKNKGLPDFHRSEYETTVDWLALKTILTSGLDPPSQATTWSVPTQLGLVVEYHVDDRADATREMLELLARARTLARPQLLIERLAIQLVPPTPPRHAEPSEMASRALLARGRALGSFLRALLMDAGVGVETIVLFGCSSTDYRLVGAALSAVAHASPAIAALRCSELGDASQPNHQLLRLAWLFYAVHRRQSDSPLSLSLLSSGIAMNDHERAYVDELMASGTPLRDIVGDALRMWYGDTGRYQRVDWLRLGSTVRLGRGTQLYYEPVAHANDADDGVVVTLWDTDDTDETEVDAVAHVVERGVVAVVYAGKHGAPLSSLALTFDCAQGDLPATLTPFGHRVAAILPLLSSDTLETLALDLAVVLHVDLAVILSCLSRLRTLVLDRCVVESLAPLVDAYSRVPTWRRSRVAVLSLLGTRDVRLRSHLVHAGAQRNHRYVPDEHDDDYDAPAWIFPLVDAFASGIARGVLCELHVDCNNMGTVADERAVIERLAHGVRTSALQLKRLHVVCNYHLQGTCAALLILSVLRAFRCVVPEVVFAVLTLAEGSVVRLVTWDSESNL